ncbi:hypothetical protein RHMOL_Rhmol03G0200800 [Rhododendron molle]|uniref:Uncharacterized protein n=1 Tax=Rhododendron molle TaxID=49168 RepID=A0ACC0PGJ2_RHOML|nr:hypothetical protein RHMOL_Rhmol03G0200800 [Rhododendron molle]
MPSRHLLSPPDPPQQHQAPSLIPPLAGAAAAALSLLILLTIFLRKLTRKRTVPSDSKPPLRYSYSALRRATSSFSPSHRIGRGGLGSVYRGSLPTTTTNLEEIAVKVIDACSIQAEREFQNELLFAGRIESGYVVSVRGFSSDHKRRVMLLVYELMSNGSLQECLLYRKCVELKEWKNRFKIAIEVAKGLEYLHHCCDPPVIHGDVKPSNVLLDRNFNAKIGDFGLARLKETEEDRNPEVELTEELGQDNDTESVTTTSGIDEFNFCVNQSPEEGFVRVVTVGQEASPEAAAAAEEISLRTGATASPVAEGNFDRGSVESGTEMVSDSGGEAGRMGKRVKKSRSVKDWWWKQDNEVGEAGGVVKDYVMEWIGSEIKKERPKSEWVVGGASTSGPVIVKPEKPERKKDRRRLDWWTSLDEDKVAKREKRRPAREWWKEEYCEELARKKKKKKNKQGQGTSSLEGNSRDDLWPVDVDFYVDRKKKRRSSRSSSRNSVDWWLDGLSGELWRGGRGGDNGHESAGGDIPKSCGVSSTPSMRGTVCYVAPEYGGGGAISEKCDVYSYGVLLLVLISGRRPLQVTGSPMSEFKRANLISWAKQLARAGKLLDLVDKSIQVLDKEQALLCITIALLCLQKSPARRPSMKDVVGMLSGELEPPRLPVEFSPSTPSRFTYKSQRKGRLAAVIQDDHSVVHPVETKIKDCDPISFLMLDSMSFSYRGNTGLNFLYDGELCDESSFLCSVL